MFGDWCLSSFLLYDRIENQQKFIIYVENLENDHRCFIVVCTYVIFGTYAVNILFVCLYLSLCAKTK